MWSCSGKNVTSKKMSGNRIGAKSKYRECQSCRRNSEHWQSSEYKKVSHTGEQSNKSLTYNPNGTSKKDKN